MTLDESYMLCRDAMKNYVCDHIMKVDNMFYCKLGKFKLGMNRCGGHKPPYNTLCPLGRPHNNYHKISNNG